MSDHRTSYQLQSHHVADTSHKDTDNTTQPKQALLMDIPAEPCLQSSSHADCDVLQQLQDSAPKDDFLENSQGSQDNISQPLETQELLSYSIITFISAKDNAEKVERKTIHELEIHHSIYKDSLHAFNVELATARQTFFSNLINSNLNNTCTIFATVERLTNPPSQIPSEMLSDSKCNEFASFFSEKISNIRKEIGTSLSYAEVTQIQQQSQKEVTIFF